MTHSQRSQSNDTCARVSLRGVIRLMDGVRRHPMAGCDQAVGYVEVLIASR